jgi:hypothetical protein
MTATQAERFSALVVKEATDKITTTQLRELELLDAKR